MEDKKYAIELEVITPLSVGAGNDNEWMRGIDYVQKDGLYRSFNKMMIPVKA